jgi:hypothetical protein
MGFCHSYTIFDRGVVDPVWGMSWKEIFRRYPKTRGQISELIQASYRPRGIGSDEPSDDELAEIFETRTVVWTLRRSRMQLWLMYWLICTIPALRKHGVTVSTHYIEDFVALIAAGIRSFAQGTVTSRTLLAMLHLHAWTPTTRPRGWLRVPKQAGVRVDRLRPPKSLLQPVYGWLREWEDEWGCLNSADTRRFLEFLERAWEENEELLFFIAAGSGVSVTDITKPRFRDLDLAQQLIAATRKTRKFKRPCVMTFLT